MTRPRIFIYALAASVAASFLALPLSLPAAESALTLRGRVDVSGLDLGPGPFTVKALQPQKRSAELGKAATNSSGDFELTVDDGTLALYGVLLEATSASNAAVVLQAAVLRSAEAESSITINASSTMEAAILGWRVKSHGADLDALRPLVLFDWLRPVSETKTKERLKRAGTWLVKWAVAAAGPASQSSAALLAEALGDVRQIGKRLTQLRVAPAGVKQLEETAKKDAEVAYLLLMPYFLEL